MKFKSAMVTQASGSIGGMTASHNKGGLYFRGRSIPVNPNTPAQQAARNAATQLAAAWNDTVTAAQRTAWQAYADNVPITSKLGDPINVSGFNMYVRCNQPRLLSGEPRVDAGPTTFNLGDFTAVTASASEATQVISVAYDNSDAWANEDDAALLIQTSAPVSPTINFFKGPFRYTTKVQGDGTTAPTSPEAVAAIFPFVESQVVFIRVRASRADGRLSGSQIVRIVAAA